MNRRLFLQTTLTTSASLPLLPSTLAQSAADPEPNALPRWRGFNLLEKYIAEKQEPFREEDFRWIAEWGFNFVRLPMSYQCWAQPKPDGPQNWMVLDEKVLRELDAAVEYGRRYKVHTNLNLHRIPGYCVNPPAEPLNLWTDKRALEAAVFHWKHLAGRYKGRPNSEVSFDLINEPSQVDEETYVRVVRALVEGIRSVDPNRLIIADGLEYGTKPVYGLADLRLGQSTRGYNPLPISHYQASWVPIKEWPKPTWPMNWMGVTWDRAFLKSQFIRPWQQIQAKGVGVHVGEWGTFNKTPHSVTLAWMEDNLKLWQEAGWGWSLWNFRGSFGILNSDRTDVAYKDYKGQKLDAAMLALLRSY